MGPQSLPDAQAPTTHKISKRARMVSWISGNGIEIGALHNPLALPTGASVRYVDRLPERELRRHYPELAHFDLAPVSILGDAQDLSALADGSVDFVIANHLVEHLDNPILGLREMYRVLHDGGILYLALPDPRATYDRNRPLTTVDHLLAEHRGDPSSTRRAHYEEWVDLVEPLLTDWQHVLTGLELDREAQVRMLMEIEYSIHFHVWRPETFLEFVSVVRREFQLDYELIAFEPCVIGVDDEFIFVFRKGDAGTLPALPTTAQAEASISDVSAVADGHDPVRVGRIRAIGAELSRLERRAASEFRSGGMSALTRLVVRRARGSGRPKSR